MRPRSATDRGSALLLYPAGVVVLLCLAAITVDLTLVRTARRELSSVLQAAADDAAGAADPARLHVGDRLTVDLDRARRIVAADLERVDLPGRLVGGVDVRIGAQPSEVVVQARMEVPAVFLGALPGVPETTTIEVTATGRRLQL
jgi:hypothetical protein